MNHFLLHFQAKEKQTFYFVYHSKKSGVSTRNAEKCSAKIDTLKGQTSVNSQIFGNYVKLFAESYFL